MGYRTLRHCVDDLLAQGRMIAVDQEVDARLEVAEIHRRVFQSGGPALYFPRVKGCRFPLASNLFGTIERARFLFRDTLESVRRLIELKIDPQALWRKPTRYWGAPFTALRMLPKSVRGGPVLRHSMPLEEVPGVVSWPEDGGPFVTLPQVYTEDVERPGMSHSNLGMYRIQLSGNQYAAGSEIGLHYQIHRGIGVHHAAAVRKQQPLRVNVFVGGTPAMSLAAVMPLPEGMSELTFAGALAGHRIPMITRGVNLPVYAEADFCISGTVDLHRNLPEGPFGDHLGYYSLVHDFPVLRVDRVTHRPDAIWLFTVVGRPPQEDTAFGALIHEITAPIIPTVIHGVHAVHAVDAAGVHPLLLAIGSERYTPYAPQRQPQELLTQASAILGQGQLSLAKFLWIMNRADDPSLDLHDVAAFFMHMLRRVDWRRDLHFHTRTTIDTLDYSGEGLNAGSKLVVAAIGEPQRELPTSLAAAAESLERLPVGFRDPRMVLPGVLAITGPRYPGRPDPFNTTTAMAYRTGRAAPGESAEPPRSGGATSALDTFCAAFDPSAPINRFPLIVIVDDSDFVARHIDNFVWVTFTRSNPATDIDGIASSTAAKHWGCRGSLVIDARIKPHHAPPLVEDAEVTRRVDALAARGGPLARWL